MNAQQMKAVLVAAVALQLNEYNHAAKTLVDIVTEELEVSRDGSP